MCARIISKRSAMKGRLKLMKPCICLNYHLLQSKQSGGSTKTCQPFCIPEVFPGRAGLWQVRRGADPTLWHVKVHICCRTPLFFRCLWITHAAAVVTAAQTWSNWRCQPAHKDTRQTQNRAQELTAAGFRLWMQGSDSSDGFNPRALFNPNYILL